MASIACGPSKPTSLEPETAGNLLARLRADTSPQLVLDVQSLEEHASPLSLKRGDVVEIQGPPNSAKTSLTMSVIATSLAPFLTNPDDMQSWNKAAVFVDTDGQFKVTRFRQLLRSRIRKLLDNSSVENYVFEEAVLSCLRRLVVLRVNSSIQLASAIQQIPNYLSKHLPDAELSLVAVDSISAFYWPDRFDTEYFKPQEHSSASIQTYYPLRSVLYALEQLRISSHPVIIMTNHGLKPLSPGPFYKQHLFPFPAPFGNRMNVSPQMESVLTSAADLVRLTHHFTMSRIITPSQLHLDGGDGTNSPGQTKKLDGVSPACSCFVRTPNRTRFTHVIFRVQSFIK